MAIQIKSRKRLDEITDLVLQHIKDIEEARRDTDKVAMELYKNYNSILSRRFYDGDSKIFVPFSFMMVETVVAKEDRAIWAEAVPVPFAGTGPEDKDQAEKIRALMNQQQKSQVKLRKKIQNYLRARSIYPRAYAEVKWRTDYRTVTRPKVETEDPTRGAVEDGAIPKPSFAKISSEQKRVATYDCWDIDVLDYFDVGVDPTAPDGDIQRARFTYVRSLVTDEELRIMAEEKDSDGVPILQKLKEVEGAGEGTLPDEYIEKKDLLGINVANLPTNENVDGNVHEMHTCYMHCDIRGDGVEEANCLFILLDRTTLIRADYNPHWHGMKPYISGSYFPRPNQFEGQSLIQPSRKIQYEINDFRNLGLDSAKYSLMQNWIVSSDSGIEDEQLRVSQGGVISVEGDVNSAIKQVIFPDLTMTGQRVEAIMESNMREATGVTRAVQGVSEAGPQQTATQFSQMLSQAGDRTRLDLENFATNEWSDLWTMVHSLNQQYLRQDTFVRMTERESMGFDNFGTVDITGELDEDGVASVRKDRLWANVNQEDLALNVDFVIPTFGEVELENVRNSNILSFLQLVQSFPPSPENRSFFNIIIRKYWVDVLKMPIEELYDDKGEFLLLTHPGAKSIYDMEAQAEQAIANEAAKSDQALADSQAAEDQALLSREDPTGGEAPLAAGGLTPADLSELQGGIPTGGNQ